MPVLKVKFESPLPHHVEPMKPVPVAGFIFYKNNSVSSVSKFYNYRKPEIVKSKYGWYIKYYYRIPVAVKHMYDNKTWFLFRVKEDMNRRKGNDREQYAQWLLNEISDSLKRGYNPFDFESKFIEQEQSGIEEKKELNATDAILLFLEAWGKRGLEPESLAKYKKVATRLMEWLKRKKIPYINIEEITSNHIENFLNDLKKEHGFSNREYNNHLDFTRTIFKFLVDKKHIPSTPLTGISKQKSKSTKHRYYDDKSLKDITRALELSDPYTLFAFNVVYYLCVRSEKELRNLKVGLINWEQSNLLIDVGKGNAEAYIPMDENIKELFLKHGIDKFPDDYFIFSILEKPDIKPFGKGFFSKRFRKVRNDAGLSKDFSLYGAKHTRVVHLKSDNVPDADIMSLTRHKDFGAYTKYLRDLGLTSDIKNINAKSRKI